MILPAMGVVSEIVPAFSRKRCSATNSWSGRSIAIAAIGFLVWGHHMFVTGQSLYAGLAFSFLSFSLRCRPRSRCSTGRRRCTRARSGSMRRCCMRFGFIGLFTIGGLTGLFSPRSPVDVHVTDTYFVVAHFHYIMVGGAVMGYFAGLHYWWPKITGRLYPECWARFAAILASSAST